MEAVRLSVSLGVAALIYIVIFGMTCTQAWREKNEGLATFMADKITGSTPQHDQIRKAAGLILLRTENDRQLALLSIRDVSGIRYLL